MTDKSNLPQLLQLIARDGQDLRQLMVGLQSHPESHLLGFGLLPYLAFYAIESSDFFNRNIPDYRDLQLILSDTTLRQSRAKMKLFDSDRGGFDGVVAQLSTIERQSIHWFNQSHLGIFGSLKRRFQDDLGCTFLGENLVMTTHVAMVNTGYSIEEFNLLKGNVFSELGKKVFESARELGSYVAVVTNALDPFLLYGTPESELELKKFNFELRDYKSGQIYPVLQNHFGLEESFHVASITWMVAQANVVHHIARSLFPPKSDFYFRARFLTAFHTLNGLRKISNLAKDRRNSLIFQVASDVLKTPESRAIRKLDNLRDIIAHYGLPAMTDRDFVSSDLLGGAVPYFGRRTSAEIDQLVDACLSDMTLQFQKLISKDFLGGRQVR